jgi:hypothetical protein
MFVAAIGTLMAICIGVVIVWGWVAFVSEAIARRTGAIPGVLYPDDVLWARFGRTLLSLGFFGGAPDWEQRHQQSLRRLHSRRTDRRRRLEGWPMGGRRA